jgi:hypothetical protein
MQVAAAPVLLAAHVGRICVIGADVWQLSHGLAGPDTGADGIQLRRA